MRNLPNFLFTTTICILCYLLLCGTTCTDSLSPSNSDKCGIEIPGEVYIWHDQLNPAGHYDGKIEDTDKVAYSYIMPTIGSVCIEEHIWAQINVYSNKGYDNYTYHSDYLGEMIYGVSYRAYFPDWRQKHDPSDDTWYFTTEINHGIKSAPNDPGWFFLNFIVSIDDQGSAQANHEEFLDIFNYIHFKYRYYEPKQ